MQPVSFSISTNAGQPAAFSLGQGLGRANVIVGKAGELVITKIQLVFTKIELNRVASTACVPEDENENGASASSTPASSEECEEVSRNPLLAVIPVDSGVHTQIQVLLAAGTFSKLEAKLGPTDNAAFVAANPSMAGTSVRVDGTFKGAPFVFTSNLRTGLELAFNPPLVIDATTKNATINIDVSRWFVTSSGDAVDPSSALSGGPNQQLVSNNIRSSFHAFEDDGMSGEDHGDRNHAGDGSGHH